MSVKNALEFRRNFDSRKSKSISKERLSVLFFSCTIFIRFRGILKLILEHFSCPSSLLLCRVLCVQISVTCARVFLE